MAEWNDSSANFGEASRPATPDNGPPADGCFICGQSGHIKADCPDKPAMTCNHCGEEGHMRRECPDKPPMTCNVCGQEGHMRRDCPEKPPMMCRNCGQEGHPAAECQNARLIDRSEVEDVTPEEAIKLMQEAAEMGEIILFKQELAKFLKHYPEMNYIQLEAALRDANVGIWLIAHERKLDSQHTLMDLQGNLGKKWAVSYRTSPKPRRPKDIEIWPQNHKENIGRLENAGDAVENMVPQCRNCNEMGHITKACPEEKRDSEQPVIRCTNCDEEGHRRRDCPVPRQDPFTCKNCKQPGHKAADCTEPRNAEGVECNKCHEMGHFSRDCPQGGGARTCRNCDQEGHMARDCPEPRVPFCRNCEEKGHYARDCPKPEDITKVKCNNCGEMGHKKFNCTNPAQAEDDFGGQAASGGNEFGSFGFNSGGGDGDGFGNSNNNAANDSTDHAWGAPAPAPAAGNDAFASTW